MRVLCLIEKVEGNQITLYNPETQNNITLSVPDDEIGSVAKFPISSF